MRKLLACVCVLVASPAAWAQPDTPSPVPALVPDWATVETVEVEARPGPPVWHITKGGSEVWILGMIGGVPKDVTWNRQYLSDLLGGANAIVMPPRAKIDLLDASWFLVTHCCHLFRLAHGKLDDILPEPTRLKLASLRQSVGGDASDYQGDEPLGAANRLNRDFRKKYGLDGESPMDAVAKLASAKSVTLEPAFRFDPMPILEEGIKLTPAQQRPCLDAAMIDIDRQAEHGRAMAQAWAVGDIAGVKAHFAEPRSMECLAAAVHAMGALELNRVPGFVTAIDAALKTPGKTIVVVPIGPLLRTGGVLEALQAQDLTIEAPKD